jgi:hypothetical protein
LNRSFGGCEGNKQANKQKDDTMEKDNRHIEIENGIKKIVRNSLKKVEKREQQNCLLKMRREREREGKREIEREIRDRY